MATSGYIQADAAFGYVRLSWEIQSQNIENNTSTISYALSIYRSSNISSTAAKSFSITINGNKVASGTNTIGGSGTKTLKTGTAIIPHNANGSKTFAYSFSQEIDITWSGSKIGTLSESGSGTLNVIPRATTPTLSASSINMNENLTITMNRASSKFTHTLTYSFNGQTGTIGTELGTSKVWTVPLTLANKIPNAASGSGTITCKTYNGSTLIGTKSVSFTAKVPASVKATINSITVTETEAGLNEQFGAFVQNRSKLKIEVAATGAYSSTIKSYKTVIDGITYTTNPCTTGRIAKSGDITISVSVTDSRGRVTTSTKTVNIAAYSPPKIYSFTVLRADADGTSNPEGEYLKCLIHYSISSVNSKNHKSYRIQYKLPEETTWTTLLYDTSSYTMDGSYVSTEVFDPNVSYDVRLQVNDYFGSAYVTGNLSTTFVLIDYNDNGKAMAIGKMSEKEEGLEIALPTYFSEAPIINGGSKMLWSGSWYMTAGHTANLSEEVVNQMSGIVLVFSKIENGAAVDNNFQFFFVPKAFIDKHRGYGCSFVLATNKFGDVATKYLYINNTYITGHVDNNATGTVNGITFNNAAFILRYVIGV